MTENVAIIPARVRYATIVGAAVLTIGSLPAQTTRAADDSPELIQPPVCSKATAGQSAMQGICTVASLGNGHSKVTVNLTAKTASIEVGGYKVVTENYNGNYLSPIVEAMPGDTVAARLENILDPRKHDGMSHGDADQNPTNLHYFHGGIVSPNNARPKPAELGDGDNIYVHLKAGLDANGNPNSFNFEVPIPGANRLDARVLEGDGFIPHPSGLNWYHAHLHGISSDQVMGGLSGLLSVGDAKANVKAGCRKNPSEPDKCLNDVEQDTIALKDRTEIRYALLRDIPLRAIGALPEDAAGTSAQWAPQDRDFPTPTQTECVVFKRDGSELKKDASEKLRKGFCQRDENSAWLFTLNGQRFPTITVDGNRNLLLRVGNLSANVAYWLELRNEADDSVLPLTVVALDGVVPAKPVGPGSANIPLDAFDVDNLLLMPASRGEIYVRNDVKPHQDAQVYILRTKGLNTGADKWPAIQLARIVLRPNSVASPITVALNAPVAGIQPFISAQLQPEEVTMPEGCVRDLDPGQKEYRRVTFNGAPGAPGMPDKWSIKTEIVRAPSGTGPFEETQFAPADPLETTIGPTPFEDYVQNDGLVDWKKKHVCVFIDGAAHKGSHKQLWVISNFTRVLHNFHIHQMKFRLATRTELEEYQIKPPTPANACNPPPGQQCPGPDYRFYDARTPGDPNIDAQALWHDTIPIPAFKKVFLIMSFDAQEQIGRFVFHCHILKHEDKGLMAPIEVWGPKQ